jgi:tripartite-type tricarboxylate transporter receptor subunit TctC
LKILSRSASAIGVVALVMLTSLLLTQARAATSYPDRPIRLVVGYATGGPADILARIVAAKLGEILGQQVFVDNRPGASGNIATENVARSSADGYTLLMATLPNAVNETLFPDFPYKFGKQIVPVAPVADTSLVLVVNEALGVKSVADLVALAKAKPGEILYATAGQGTATHLAGELFSMMSDVKLVPVHYKGGGETLKDLLSGQVKLMFSSIPPVLGLVHEGKLIGLATTGTKRDPNLPDLPTVEEAGLPRFDLSLWYGLAAPTGVPEDVLNRLENATAEALKDRAVKANLAANGYQPMSGTRAEFGDYVQREVQKWKKVVETSGMATQ